MNIDLNYLKSLVYLTVWDEPHARKERVSYRFSVNGIGISDDERLRELRQRVSKIYEDNKQAKMSTAKFEADTGIVFNSFTKARNGRVEFSREMLSKFCVGLKVPLDEAQELFRLNGYPLSECNRQDYITLQALKEYPPIDEYFECLNEHNCPFTDKRK